MVITKVFLIKAIDRDVSFLKLQKQVFIAIMKYFYVNIIDFKPEFWEPVLLFLHLYRTYLNQCPCGHPAI